MCVVEWSTLPAWNMVQNACSIHVAIGKAVLL